LLLEDFIEESSVSHLTKIGIMDRNSSLYKSKCAAANFYPFSIVTEDKRIELIATNIQSLEVWLVGLNYLAINKKSLNRIFQSLHNMKS